MRTIKYIAIHCTATKPNQSIDSIKNYWKNVLKWSYPGYNYIIKQGGNRVQLLSDNLVSNGVQGFNHETINVAYIGGITCDHDIEDTRTEQQKISLIILLKELRIKYPEAKIQGHRDFPGVHKLCPLFNAIPEYKDI